MSVREAFFTHGGLKWCAAFQLEPRSVHRGARMYHFSLRQVVEDEQVAYALGDFTKDRGCHNVRYWLTEIPRNQTQLLARCTAVFPTSRVKQYSGTECCTGHLKHLCKLCQRARALVSKTPKKNRILPSEDADVA